MSSIDRKLEPTDSRMIRELVQAAIQGEIERVQDLLHQGVNINGQDDIRRNPLRMAVSNRQIEMIRFLLDRGADPNAPDYEGCTPTTQAVIEAQSWAVIVTDPRPLELLRQAGGRLGLREAVLMSDVELARQICDENPAINVSGKAHYIFHDTFLMLAASWASSNMVRFLLDRGADIEGTDDLGVTALIKAARTGRPEIVALLLDRGAEIDHDDWADHTPLSEATANGHEAVVELLLSRGAEPCPAWDLPKPGVEISAQDANLHSTLALVIHSRKFEMVQVLLGGGGDPNMPDCDECTPTTQEVSSPDPQSLELLRQTGVHIESHEDVLRSDVELARMICDENPDTDLIGDAQCSYRDIYLMLEASWASRDMVRFLLELGADDERTNNPGATALMRAARADRLDVVALLLGRGGRNQPG